MLCALCMKEAPCSLVPVEDTDSERSQTWQTVDAGLRENIHATTVVPS